MSEKFDEYEYEDGGGVDNSIKGYRIIIAVLVVMLAAIGVQYYRQTNILRGSEKELTIERDTLQNRLSSLMTDFDQIKFDNDTLNENMQAERLRADSLMDRLRSERQWSYAKVKKYEKELGTLRTIMKGYVQKIDSLDKVNTKLSQENITYRKQLTTSRQRTELAEEKNQELQSKIREGAIVRARDISLTALNDRNKEMTRATRATMLRMDCVLSANPITVPGERGVYIRITDASGALLTSASSVMFEFEGEKIQATEMREVDYRGDDLAVDIFYRGQISSGTYSVQVYMDGYMIGTNEIILK